jgi:toxin ParE1/3/4
MSSRVRWTTRARNDLLNIYLAIAIEDRSAAQTVLYKLRARVSVLTDHPRLGSRRDDIRQDLRVLVERLTLSCIA